MDLLTIDMETFYSKQFSLTKLTTEEYIRDAQFETILVSIKRNDEPTVWFSGSESETKNWLQQFDWADSACLAHNTMFDGAILSWRYGIRPRLLLDTLCMGRALHGLEVGGSLKAMAERYQVGVKGTEVAAALGMRRDDFTPEQLAAYAGYCVNDVDLTYEIFNKMMDLGFPRNELLLIDTTLRMFTEPTLLLQEDKLRDHLKATRKQKEDLLASCEADKDTLMSNPKFATLLLSFGVEPPTKVSLRTGKEAYAFAKSDEAFVALAEHDDPRVQAVVSARLGTKSTLEETRTQRFLDMAQRGPIPIPLRYYGAHTGRWAGTDSINLQNLPSRGPNAGKIKKAMVAPPGHVVIDCDSSQIEARVLAWWAGQSDLVQSFRNGEDVYKKMAATIYGIPESDVDGNKRFIGKTTILGCISEGTLVLCDTGWKPIERVSILDKLWDGKEWVCHHGLQNSGTKETLSLCGMWLTPDHKVWSGTQWREAQYLERDEYTRCQALGIAAENLPLQATYVASAGVSAQLSSSVTAGVTSTASTYITSKTSKAPDAPCVPRSQHMQSDTGVTQSQCQMMDTELGYSTGCPLQSHGATHQPTARTNTTGVEAYPCLRSGGETEHRSCGMCKQYPDGTYQVLRWTELMSMGTTNPGTYDSCPEVKTLETSAVLPTLRRKLQTYDLAYAGPRNRYTVLTEQGPMIVHNCGYGMGAVKFQAQLKTFGVSVDLDETKRIINVYRRSNDQIAGLWRQAQNAILALSQGDAGMLGQHEVIALVPEHKALRLPSGLLMRYVDLRYSETDSGLEFHYKTRNGRTKIYGGKVVENCCQAIARCIIGEQMLRIAKRYKPVLTVHDAIAICAPSDEAFAAKEYVEECMRWTPAWAQGLPVNCESGMGASYGDC